eukprot:4468850-Alexandrium_andersonii.AAC.1
MPLLQSSSKGVCKPLCAHAFVKVAPIGSFLCRGGAPFGTTLYVIAGTGACHCEGCLVSFAR